MDSELFNQLLGKYQRWGLSIIPIAHKSKKALISWQEYQKRRPQAGELGEWFSDGKPKNIGIVCGKVSGNLVVLDFDKVDKWADFLRNWPEGRFGSIYQRTPVVATGRGHQVYLRTKRPVNKQRLDGIDIQSEGSYVVAPPSIHASGKQYRFINADIDQILEIDDLSEVGIQLPIRQLPNSPDTQEEAIRQIAQLVKPYWNTGDRHNLALRLSGFLAKLGWASPMVTQLINIASMGASDEELADRLRAVSDTFQKHKANIPIQGYAGLENIIPMPQLEKLEELAKSIKAPPLMRRIDSIRLSNEPVFLRKRKIAQVVIEDMREKGRFLRTSGNELFYFNDRAIPLDSDEVRAILNREYGLNPTEQEGKYVLAELETEAYRSDEVNVYRLAHWDRSKGCLYLNKCNGQVLKIGKSIGTIGNGEEVYFIQESEHMPLEPDFTNPVDPWQCLTADLSLEIGELVALGPEQQKKVARLWILGLFFAEELPTKPILCATGDAGSGKTFFLKRFLRFLYGKGEVEDIPEESDFRASICNKYFYCLDDLESNKAPKWITQALKRSATGQTFSLRKLYTTNTEVHFTPRCFLAFTSIHPPVEDSALAERLLILRFKKLDTKEPESKMLEAIEINRNRIWGGLILEVQRLIPRVLQEPPASTFRMADWASLCQRIDSDIQPILHGLTSFQDEALLEDSPIPTTLDKWIPEQGRWYTPRELHDVWSNDDGHFPFKSPLALMRHLANVRHNLARTYGLKWRKGLSRGRKVEYNFDTTSRQ